MIYRLSPSTLNLFIECPRCFWLHIVKGIKRPDTPFPSLPNGMDRVLKEHFDRFMEKGELPPELKHLEEYKLFNDKEKLTIWRNNFDGIKYIDPESGCMLQGAVDNILIKGNKLVVLDFKTRGYPVKENTHTYYQNQMDLYNFLLRKNGYETEDYTYLLFYHPITVSETGEFKFENTLVKIQTNPDNGERIFKQAVKILQQEQPPEPSPNCQFCKWNK